jgi:hypothetical protein
LFAELFEAADNLEIVRSGKYFKGYCLLNCLNRYFEAADNLEIVLSGEYFKE